MLIGIIILGVIVLYGDYVADKRHQEVTRNQKVLANGLDTILEKIESLRDRRD